LNLYFATLASAGHHAKGWKAENIAGVDFFHLLRIDFGEVACDYILGVKL
jgi:hypothetical protein